MFSNDLQILNRAQTLYKDWSYNFCGDSFYNQNSYFEVLFLSTQLFIRMIQSSVSFMFWKGVHDLFLPLTEYGLSAQFLAQSRNIPAHRPQPYLRSRDGTVLLGIPLESSKNYFWTFKISKSITYPHSSEVEVHVQTNDLVHKVELSHR